MIVTYNRSGVFNADGVVLVPGKNAIKDVAAWGRARKHPVVAALMESTDKQPDPVIVEESTFEELVAKDPLEVKSEQDNFLATLRPPEAKRVVEDTIDLDLLERWRVGETRNQVKGAIKAQIARLKAPAEERDRSENRQVHANVDVIETVVRNPEDRE